jgi:hypothetical protein
LPDLLSLPSTYKLLYCFSQLSRPSLNTFTHPQHPSQLPPLPPASQPHFHLPHRFSPSTQHGTSLSSSPETRTDLRSSLRLSFINSSFIRPSQRRLKSGQPPVRPPLLPFLPPKPHQASSTVGRDKLYRAIQYFARFLAFCAFSSCPFSISSPRPLESSHTFVSQTASARGTAMIRSLACRR